jgi:hypothetical protein
MSNLSRVGSILFAIPLAVFGIQYLCYGRFVRGLPPVSASLSALPFLAYPLGAALVITAMATLFLNAGQEVSSGRGCNFPVLLCVSPYSTCGEAYPSTRSMDRRI